MVFSLLGLFSYALEVSEEQMINALRLSGSEQLCPDTSREVENAPQTHALVVSEPVCVTERNEKNNNLDSGTGGRRQVVLFTMLLPNYSSHFASSFIFTSRRVPRLNKKSW